MFKQCCLPKLQAFVPKKVADALRKEMSAKKLLFITEKNSHYYDLDEE